MKLVLQTIAVASMAIGLAHGQAAECPITSCINGDCVLGTSNWDDHPQDANGNKLEFLKDEDREGWHCDCPDGFVGLRCGREFEKCGDTGHYCYHGGKCIEGIEDKVAPGEMFCDCRDAQHNGQPFVGKYCEHLGAEQCGDTEIFCSNGGTCKAGFETKAHPCDCPDGHRGPHCEFLLGQVPDCSLECNGGTCQLGIKDYDTALYNQFWGQHDGKFQYCDCPEGKFGPQCDVEGQACGEFHCFNGAKCIQSTDKDGNDSFRCDCQAAATEGSSFAGQFCQSKSTTFCTDEPDQNGHLFCTNGGTCLDEALEGCECPDGFHGPICEFHDDIPPQSCDLQCENGGHCRKGTKDNQMIQQYGAELSKFNMTHSELWEHCVCPNGFFGIQCEHKLEICPGGDHVCLHGSRCVPTEEANGGNGHSCDCDHGFDSFERYAGKFCQYSSTDICTENGKPGGGKANFAFCVNNGKCKKKVGHNQPHPGCNCASGFKGDHCEFLDTPDTSPPIAAPTVDVRSSELNGEGEPYDPNEGLIIGLTVALLALAGIVIFSVVKCKMDRNEVSESAKDVTNVVIDESVPASSDDGNDTVNTPVTDASETSGPTPFEAEETVVEGLGASPEKGEMQTVEII